MNHWIEISAERLTANFHAIEAAAGPATTVLAVIKANAYGHGAETCAPILVRAGARWLGVTCANEGARVRKVLNQAGLQADILIMSGFLPEDVPLIREHALVPVIWTHEQIDWLAHATGTRVHVEVDTGMGRQGVASLVDFIQLFTHLAAFNLTLDGIFTHLCSSEVAASPITARQQQRFEEFIHHLKELPNKPRWLHVANTSAVDNPNSGLAWIPALAATLNAKPLVRTGLALYGYTLPLEGDATPRLRSALQPVLTWKARILSTRDLAPGDTVGYNATYTADRPMRVALIPAGYADGLRRELSSTNEKSGGWVMIHNQRAPILGRISMNLTVVDVTHIPATAANDDAILLGPGITAEDHAHLAHTIPYEILCALKGSH